MSVKKVYLNGRMVAAERAKVSVFDRGLNYGDGVFETIKASGGNIEFLKDHLERLKKDAHALGIPTARLAPFFRDIRQGAIKRLLKANGLTKAAYIKIVVTRGEDIRRGLAPVGGMEPTVIMTAGPLDEKAIRLMRATGVRAVLVKGFHPAMPGVKTLNYLPSVLARMEARKAGVEEAVFTAPDGALLEAAGANLFIVERGVIRTPPLNEDPFLPGVLPGVMRKAVIELAGKLGIRVMAARLHEGDLRRCDEAFLTNSTCGVVPLVSVDSVKVADGRPGPVTRGLQCHL